jgi:triosephosphate isomerase (TIM)
MTAPTPLIAGNWKMNGAPALIDEARIVASKVRAGGARVAICPPTPLIHRLSEAMAGSAVLVGAQDNHDQDFGAFTGDVSAQMLAEAGAKLVILGHSERRAAYRESDELVARKVAAALRAGLEPIVCVGESLQERQAGRAVAVVTGQLRGSLPRELAGRTYSVAYEPVWAIGTGKVATPGQAQEVHLDLRKLIADRYNGGLAQTVRILYGGSVKAANAAELLSQPDVDGALVGGASLKADEFLAIAAGAPRK